jgi:hypothetical protein
MEGPYEVKPFNLQGLVGISELTRRLGFEYNGMVLHEYYFGNLIKGGAQHPQSRLCVCENSRRPFLYL